MTLISVANNTLTGIKGGHSHLKQIGSPVVTSHPD